MSRIHVTRIVLETVSPMVINSGRRELAFDNELVRDANGLPYIPATAIAGVWRSLAADSDAALAEAWFGSLQQKSRLQLQPAVIHNARNQPMLGLIQPDTIANDVVLQRVHQAVPLQRDRVAINDRGVAKETAKFDQIMLPAGLRFSTTIKWQQSDAGQSEQATEEWQQLLRCWADRRMAFGASTRNGLGQIKLVGLQQQCFDLKQGPAAAKAMQQFAREVPTSLASDFTAQSSHLLADIPLQALDTWRCGAGSALLGKAPASGSVAIISYSEPALAWKNNQAHWLQHKPVLCGSSIKGILAHRIAFHYRRHAGIFAEQMAEAGHSAWEQRPDELADLLGCIADNDANSRAGLLYVDDSPIAFEHTVLRTHNAIDRFTGGVMNGALYSEELLYQPRFRVRLWLAKQAVISPALKAALLDTLSDLQQGLLPLGAGSGRGSSLVQQDANQQAIVNPDLLTDVQQEVAS